MTHLSNKVILSARCGRKTFPSESVLSVIRGKSVNFLSQSKSLWTIIFLVHSSITLYAQQDSTASQLDHYLREAAQNNPELKALVYEYRSILEQAPQVGTLPDPEVMFMYFTNPRNYSSPFSRMTLSASQR